MLYNPCNQARGCLCVSRLSVALFVPFPNPTCDSMPPLGSGRMYTGERKSSYMCCLTLRVSGHLRHQASFKTLPARAGMGRAGAAPPAAVRVVAAVAEGLTARYRSAWPAMLPGAAPQLTTLKP